MKKLAWLFVLLGSCCPLFHADGEQAAETGVPAKPVPELNALIESHEASAKKLVLQTHDSEVEQLNVQYLEALRRALEQAQQAGQLEDALAIEAEKKAIEGNGAPPDGEVKEAHLRLAVLRTTYRSNRERLDAERDRKLDPLHRDLLERLNALVVTLTRAGRLEDALTVKNRGKDLETAGAGKGEPDKEAEADKMDKIDRLFVNRTWISAAQAHYRFDRGGEGERTHGGVPTPFTWTKRDDGLVMVKGQMAPDSALVTWYFKFDNRDTALFGTRPDSVPYPLTAE